VNIDILWVRDIYNEEYSLCFVCENSFVCDDVARAVLVSDDVAYGCRKKWGRPILFGLVGSLGESFCKGLGKYLGEFLNKVLRKGLGECLGKYLGDFFNKVLNKSFQQRVGGMFWEIFRRIFVEVYKNLRQKSFLNNLMILML